jgi:trans-2,3-dihydro-3-hydroxyanthranilate isomerase
VTTRRYEIVDAFTDTPLAGNAAAIFPDGEGLTGELMQRVARELNLSETVFVLPAEGEGDARVRIFTPSVELPFAGHPVLATAFVLGRGSTASVIRLQTGAGPVSITLQREDGEVTSQREDGEVAFAEMEQPIPVREAFPHVSELLAALGVERSGLPVEAYWNGPTHVYVALDTEERVAALRPDAAALEDLGDRFGFSCFARTGDGRYKTRMFAPGLGVREDPATGSAAGPLALHLARHGWIAYGESILIRQGEEIHRPSLIHARVEGSDEAIERVAVGGSAVVVARGEYRLE